jgi:hypothetical protein
LFNDVDLDVDDELSENVHPNQAMLYKITSPAGTMDFRTFNAPLDDRVLVRPNTSTKKRFYSPITPCRALPFAGYERSTGKMNEPRKPSPKQLLMPEIIIETSSSEKDIMIGGEIYNPSNSPDHSLKHSKSRSRTKESKCGGLIDEPTPNSDYLGHIKRKLDSNLSDEESPTKLDECNRNLVEELCGATIDEIEDDEVSQML